MCIELKLISKFASIVEFSHTYRLGKYLGFPMLTWRIKKSDFAYILDMINGRIAGWKGKLLSKAGLVTLGTSPPCLSTLCRICGFQKVFVTVLML